MNAKRACRADVDQRIVGPVAAVEFVRDACAMRAPCSERGGKSGEAGAIGARRFDVGSEARQFCRWRNRGAEQGRLQICGVLCVGVGVETDKGMTWHQHQETAQADALQHRGD